MNRKGSLIVLSGPSGVGKGTVIKRLLARDPDMSVSVSATTRAKRPGEVHGEDYYFLTKEEFLSESESGGMLEYAVYNGNYYGTPLSAVEEKLKKGVDVILEIEVKGAMQVRKLCPEALSIFVLPPSSEELRKRLISRGTENEKSIESRMWIAAKEMRQAREYNYIVVNHEPEIAAEDIKAIVRASKCRKENMMDFLKEVCPDAEAVNV